jgi:hypothetical protein
MSLEAFLQPYLPPLIQAIFPSQQQARSALSERMTPGEHATQETAAGAKFSLSDLQPVKPSHALAAARPGQRRLPMASSPFPTPAPRQSEKPVFALELLQPKTAVGGAPASRPPAERQQQQQADRSLEEERAQLLDRIRHLELELQSKRQASHTAHVFVDNSNLMYGARSMPDGSRDERVLLDVDALVDLMTKDTRCESRFVAGSNIPEAVRRRWEGKGFKVMEELRAPGTGEQFVDEALHSCISRAILDELPQTLILGTGDGNEKEGTNSFPGLARSAARNGWKVVVWGWMSSTSPRFYDVKREFPDRIEIRYLDNHRDTITFTSGSRQPSPQTSASSGCQGRSHRSAPGQAPRTPTIADFLRAPLAHISRDTSTTSQKLASPAPGRPACSWASVTSSQI